MPSDLTTTPTQEMAIEAAKKLRERHRSHYAALAPGCDEEKLWQEGNTPTDIMARYILSMKDEHDPYDDLIASGGLGHEHESVWPKVNRDQPPEAI